MFISVALMVLHLTQLTMAYIVGEMGLVILNANAKGASVLLNAIQTLMILFCLYKK